MMKMLFFKRSPVFHFLGKKRPGGGLSVLCNGNPAAMAAMAVAVSKMPPAASSPLYYVYSSTFTDFHKLSSTFKTFSKPTPFLLPHTQTFRDLGLLNIPTTTPNLISRRALSSSTSSCNAAIPPPPPSKTGRDWRILKRWDVPWDWKIVSLTSAACGLTFYLTGFLVKDAARLYFGIQIKELSFNEKAVMIFVMHAITTAATLGVLYGLTNTFKLKPLPDDMFCYDWRKPFNLQKGWLLWAGIGLVGASVALVVAVAMHLFDKLLKSEKDAVDHLLLFNESSPVSTAFMLGVGGVLAPVLEETVFRGFLMVSLTKWVPTPVAVLISASVFALAHCTPDLFLPQFMIGTVLGFSYAQTRNLLTPITIHAYWNSRAILRRYHSQASRI